MQKKRLQPVRIIGVILFLYLRQPPTLWRSSAGSCPTLPNAATQRSIPPYGSSTAVVSTSPVCDSIKILPGTYAANVTLDEKYHDIRRRDRKNVPQRKRSTAITVSGVNSAAIEIRNLTFTNASPGILVQNASSFNIKNSIFQVETRRLQSG
jgi:hypothetical protein